MEMGGEEEEIEGVEARRGGKRMEVTGLRR